MTGFIVFFIMLLAGAVQGSCGFGAGLVGMALLPLFLTYKTALPVMFIASAVLSLNLLLRSFKSINWQLFILPTMFSFLGRILGLLAFQNFHNSVLSIILGSLIFLIALFQLGWSKKIRLKPSTKNSMLAGSLSGVLGGLASASGPPLVLYYMNLALPKQEYLATIQASFLAGALFSISLLAASGGYDASILQLGLFAASGIFLGSLLGYRFFARLKQDALHKLINYVLLLMGISLIIKEIF